MNETKEETLSVALELFSWEGYTAVTIRDICKEVNIKESPTYYHFANKQEFQTMHRFGLKLLAAAFRLPEAYIYAVKLCLPRKATVSAVCCMDSAHSALCRAAALWAL